MKKTIAIISLCFALTACYEPYVTDYEYSAVSIAYQYDLRTLVVGEGMSFDFGVMLSGVIDNTVDRTVQFEVDNSLVEGAYPIMMGTSSEGSVSQSYVTEAVRAAGISSLYPVPENLYSIEPSGTMVIKQGRHTATATFKADSAAMLADANVKPSPYYAFAWRVTEADADQILEDKSFGVIALRIENRFFGSWYHGGHTVVRKDISSEIVSEEWYSGAVPQPDTRIYTLTSTGPFSVRTNRFANSNGILNLAFDGYKITVSSPTKTIEPLGESSFNGARLLQDRKLFLNYKYSNGDGTTTYVHDTLSFRNRLRDGVNEWQDPDPEHYK